MQDDSRNWRRRAADSVARRCALARERTNLMRHDVRRVVVEYRFRAYSPPSDLEASRADACRVTYAEVPMTKTNRPQAYSFEGWDKGVWYCECRTNVL